MSLPPSTPPTTATEGHRLLAAWLGTQMPDGSNLARARWLMEKCNAHPAAKGEELKSHFSVSDWFGASLRLPGMRWRVILDELTEGDIPFTAWDRPARDDQREAAAS